MKKRTSREIILFDFNCSPEDILKVARDAVITSFPGKMKLTVNARKPRCVGMMKVLVANKEGDVESRMHDGPVYSKSLRFT